MRVFLTIGLTSMALLIMGQSDEPCSGAGAPNIAVNPNCVSTTAIISATDQFQSNAANFGIPTCGLSGADVWYAFVAPASGNVDIITTAGTISDAVMSVYDSDCTTYTELACDDDGGTLFMPELNLVGLTPGQVYYIRLWEWGGGTGSFDICVVEVGGSGGSGNQDCSGATGVCSNASFSGNSNGGGSISDLNGTNQGCLLGENQSSWYEFQAQTTGPIDLTISPQNGTDDYDFAIWGPNPTCPPSAPPIRCSYAAGGGDTGLVNGSGDNSEGATGDRWVEDFNMNAGEVYMMVIDNWSATTSPFDLTWGGSAVLDCSVLPVLLTDFSGVAEDYGNRLSWRTASESGSSHFIIERSVDGYTFLRIGRVEAQGSSYSDVHYAFERSLGNEIPLLLSLVDGRSGWWFQENSGHRRSSKCRHRTGSELRYIGTSC